MMILSIVQFLLCAACTCAIENLALQKPAWQKHNWPDKPVAWGANKSVDGQYSVRTAPGNQCTISGPSQQKATLRVDLERVSSISYINIFYRTGGAASPGAFYDRFAGFYLYVSNTTSKDDGRLCFHELQNVNGTPTEDQRINCSVHGRYVIYYNERMRPNVTYPSYYSQYAYNELCELEVYGCPDPGYYGDNCNKSCPENCQGHQCDAVTGYCVNGCISGYQGPLCSYLNLALRRPALQQHNWPNKPVAWGAAKAVDGKYSDRGAFGEQCTISGPGQRTAEWRVDLQSVVSISHINIYYRTDNAASPGAYYQRFAGFFVYVSNDTSKDNGSLCFHEIQTVSGTPVENQTISCPYDGRYVIYYNERKAGVTYPSYYSPYAYNELCEFEVYGCPGSRYYGQYCKQSCPVICLERRCNISTGNCLECSPGYKGPRCSQKCDGGMFGAACSQNCGHCFDNAQCHHVNGTCPGACAVGYKRPLCFNKCDGGKYGLKCNESCGHCSEVSHCHHINGTCLAGCSPGYKRPLCTSKCDGGMYGANCSQDCGNCLNDAQCHHINGTCLQGCSAGYKRWRCTQICDGGMYGDNCNQKCGHCLKEIQCHHINGTCLGCSTGYKGSLCKDECDSGMFGANCNESCGYCLNDTQCHHINGTCLEGCSTGYKGLLCTEECDDGKYGVNCNESCGHCLNDTQCHHINGTCLEGCAAGYKGSLCIDKCDSGTYGDNCNQTCGHCLNDTHCHHINGTCLLGCSTGYKGLLCKEECDGGKYGVKCNESCGHCLNDTQCHHINGTCLVGCAAGYNGLRCIDKCLPGMHGYNCVNKCGHCFNDTNCDPVTGSCLNGCASGYEGSPCIKECGEKKWGENCWKNCSTNCVDQICNHSSGVCISRKPLQDNTSSTLPMIGGVIAAIFIFIIVVVSVIFIRRSRAYSDKKKRKTNTEANTLNVNTTSKPSKMGFSNIYENMEGTSQFKENKSSSKNSSKQGQELKTRSNERDNDIDNDEKLHEENPYGDLYINEETIPDINIEQLEHAIKEKRKNEDDGFKREYAAMPYGERYPCDAGKQQDNIPKNRFKTTFPYDHSRIKLTNSKSDYINANFIDGIENKNEYIAAQGPRQNTMADFWTMIWQENVNQIVMLTNLKEGKQAKCVKYWPDQHQTSTFGVFSLRAEEEQSYAYYKIRKFRVTHKGLNKSRIVTQYHYTAWPDHGTPEPLCLVVFHDHVTRTKIRNTGPTLVHCSAGIGRTGTYIAIDALYKSGKTERKVNIAEYVKKMRENRMNMVQTYEQYITIFLALDAMFKAPTRVHTKPEFLRKAELMTRDKPANESELREEFQNLVRVRPSYTEVDYKLALQSGKNTCKSTVLPLDKYSLFLSSSVPKRGNYINAVTLPSYTKNKTFIVTHYPSPEDAVDFLRLLTDHDSDVVICMDPLRDVASAKQWLPTANNSKSVSPFTVHGEHEQVTETKCTTISINQNGTNDEGCSVSIIEPTASLTTSERSRTTAQMLRLVSFALQSETEGPFTIVSSDGAAPCGVFCAVYNVLQQFSVDGEVDIFSAVRLLQIRRPELCSSLEEYRMIYNVVLDYIRAQEDSSEENIYCNQ